MSVKGGTTQKNSGVASVPLNLKAPPTPSYTFPLTTQEERQTMQLYQHWLSEQQQNIEARCEARRQLIVKKSENKPADWRLTQEKELRKFLKEQQNHEILIERHNKLCDDKIYEVPLRKRPAVPLDSSDGAGPSSDRLGPSPSTQSQPRHTGYNGPISYPHQQLPMPRSLPLRFVPPTPSYTVHFPTEVEKHKTMVYEQWLSDKKDDIESRLYHFTEQKNNVNQQKGGGKNERVKRRQAKKRLLEEQRKHTSLIESHLEKCGKCPWYEESRWIGIPRLRSSGSRDVNPNAETLLPQNSPMTQPDNHSTVDMDILDGSDDEEDNISIVLPQPVHAAQPGEPSSEKNTRYCTVYF